MTPDTLAAIGRALYGDRWWQSALATDLGVSDRTMRRWVAGTSPVPAGVDAASRALLDRRRGEIDRLLAA